jgi:tetratricopeptide (TPR) repeat protein
MNHVRWSKRRCCPPDTRAIRRLGCCVGSFSRTSISPTSAEPQGDTLRDEALASLSTCLDLDTGLVYQDNATQAFEFLTKTCYNDAAKALNDLRPERAEALYLKYKRHAARTGGIPDEKAKEVEFYNALGTVHTKLYNQDRENLIWYDRALVTYHAVLKMDPENYGANYNLATLYYNRGVYNIQRVDVENDIPSLQRIQEVSREFFLEALPFMLKAFEMNPKRKETLLGLEGIYYSLQDPRSPSTIAASSNNSARRRKTVDH